MDVINSETNLNTSKKRKLSSQESVVEVSDEDACLDSSGSGEVEIVDLETKIPLVVDTVPSQSSNGSLDHLSYNSQNSVEIITQHSNGDMKFRLLELEDKIQQLKAENEGLKSKSCACHETHSRDLITIRFNSVDTFRKYKSKFIKIFGEFINLEIEEREANLLMSIIEDNTINADDWVVIDDIKCTLPLDKRKKKKKKKSVTECDGSTNNIFMLDTTPSISTKNNLQYESKFDFVNTTTSKSVEIPAKPSSNTCFNCDEAHNLRDCTKPKNHSKINAARQKFKPQNKGNTYKRYHLEDEQRFGHLQVGKMSQKLQEALGLRHNQLPEHIYRMRQLGYPPGWFNEILALQESELVLFDFTGKDASKQKRMVQDLDINKIIDYHGFNVPLQKGFKDEYRIYGSPAYSKELSKAKMIDYLKGLKEGAKDNLESCDMDIDHLPPDKEIEVLNISKTDTVKEEIIVISSSPTLVELETAKEKLLAELTDDVSQIVKPAGLTENDLQLETLKDISTVEDEHFVTLDETGSIDDPPVESTNEITPDKVGSITEETVTDQTPATPIQNLIKTSYFGTPILKSFSPYSRLPHSENFTKDVSDVINFENLPNSTGKYEQMVGVIGKVRRTLKNLNDSQL